MTTRKQITNVLTIAIVAMAIVGLTVGSANAGQIFFDDFSGGAGTDLHGTTPDVTPGGESWVARSHYKADGSFSWDSPGAMTLAFTPVHGGGLIRDVPRVTRDVPGHFGDVPYVRLT